MHNEFKPVQVQNRAFFCNKCDICKTIVNELKVCPACKVNLCFDCIQSMLAYSIFANTGLNSNFFDENSDIPFFCFSCKSKQSINTLEIQNILKDNERKIQTVFCDYCDQNEAKYTCMDCTSMYGDMIKMCPNCHSLTHRKKLNQHKIVDFNLFFLCICQENNICTKICQDCLMILCLECTERNHKNHIVKNIDDQFEQAVKRKQEKIFSLIKNNKNEIFNNDYQAIIQQEENQIDFIITEFQNHLNIVNSAMEKLIQKKTRGQKIRIIYENFKNKLDNSIFENFPIHLKFFLTQKLPESKLDLDFQKLEFKPLEQKVNKIRDELHELSKRINTIVESFSPFEIKCFKLGVKVNEKESEFFKNFSENAPFLTIERPIQFKYNQEKVLCPIDIDYLNNQKVKALVFGVDCEGKVCSNLEIHKIMPTKKNKNIEIEKVITIESHLEKIRLINKFENFLYTCAEDIHVYPNINDLDNFNPNKRKVFKHFGKNECIRSVHMLRDRTKELVENIKSEENIYLLFSLEKCSSVFLINYKDKRLCKEFRNEGNQCTYLDSFYHEKDKKLYLILGYQLSFIEVWEFVSSSSFNLVARYSSNNFCLNSMKIELLKGKFYFYFGFGNGAKKIGKISKYEFKKQKVDENQLPLTEFEVKDNQIFAMTIIEENLIAATQEYLYRLNKHNFEEGFTKSCKFKDAKISDAVYIKEKDVGELLAIISFHTRMVSLFKL